jgi:hypothetical protein
MNVMIIFTKLKSEKTWNRKLSRFAEKLFFDKINKL